jgi:hypothetical protein
MPEKTAPAEKRSQPKLQPNLSKNRKVPSQFQMVMNKGFVYVLIGLLFIPAIISYMQQSDPMKITMSQLVRDIRDQKIERIEVAGPEMRAKYKDTSVRTARKEDFQEMVPLLQSAGIDIAQIDIDILKFGTCLCLNDSGVR